MPATMSINRAPVLTLWAAVVARRLVFRWDESLSLGKALAGLNAQSKGRRLGIFRPHEEKTKAARAAMTTLAHAYRPRELAAEAFALHEEFRPVIPEGVRGWGAKGVLDLRKIRSLATYSQSEKLVCVSAVPTGPALSLFSRGDLDVWRSVHRLIPTTICIAAILAVAVEAAESTPLRKPTLGDTIRVNVYADNWFVLYINGELVAVDSIAFIPHNVISVDLLPTYPMTIAVMAKDNADPKTGMEYANSNIGDAGFILKFTDGTVTNGSWKARCFSHGPVGGATTNPRVENKPIPANWFATDFDDSDWKRAREFTEKDVDPKQPFYDADFKGATFIWTDDLKLDNTVIFRHRVEVPPDGKARPDFSRLNDVVPSGPQKPGGRPGGKPPRKDSR